jgi:hypothetical protein
MVPVACDGLTVAVSFVLCPYVVGFTEEARVVVVAAATETA